MADNEQFTSDRKRITFDNSRQIIVFERCIERRSFWNLIPLKHAECRFDEVWHVQKTSINGVRLAGIEIPAGTLNVSDEDWENFESIVSSFDAMVNPTACPEEIRNPKKSPITIALFVLIFLGIAAVTLAGIMGWF